MRRVFIYTSSMSRDPPKLFKVGTNGVNFTCAENTIKPDGRWRGRRTSTKTCLISRRSLKVLLFFNSSVTLTPRFVDQVYRFMAVIPRIRQVTLSAAKESHNSERFRLRRITSKLISTIIFFGTCIFV